MKEDWIKNIDDQEDISQVPLEARDSTRGASNRPVGASHVSGGRRKKADPSGNTGAKNSRTGFKISSVRAEAAENAGKTGPKEGQARQSRQTPGKGGSRRRSGGGAVSFMALLLALILGAAAGFGGGYYLWGWERPYTVDLKAVEVPDWVKQDFIRKNIFSRPDVGRQTVDKIVVHYVANPGSTAENNRNYFDSLADQEPQKGGTSASSHFVVGLEGEVIQCIPVNEIAYANAPINNTAIAIEVCHPDESGKFNDATYDSVVRLTAWLCKQLKLSTKDVIRHYDVNGKICPKYFVDDEEAWKQFQKDVKKAIKDNDF